MRSSCVLMLLASLVVAGCQLDEPEQQIDYKTVATDPRRDTELARQRNAAAVAQIKADQLDSAETELKAAIAADMFFGPAHNNLGMVYHAQEKHYLAAWEFQYAMKLMPNRAEPRCNLGQVFETVGRLDDAAKWYEEALQIQPDRPEIIANLARLYVRDNRTDERTKQLLSEVSMRDDRPEWTSWARERLAAIGQPEAPTTQPVGQLMR